MAGKSRLRLTLAVALGVSLLAPTTSHGVVTIGSNLGRTLDGSSSCGGGCTFAQAALASEFQAPNGLVSPVNGTITLWRIRVGDSASPTSLRVIRRLGGGLSTGAGTSAPVTPQLFSINSFPAQLPIAIGETIGINCCQTGASSEYFVSAGGIREVWFAPQLADGGPGRAPTATIGWEMALNADIEPTSAFRIVKAKPKKRGKVQVTVDSPNAGTLAAGDKRAKLAAAAGTGKKKVKYLKSVSTQVTAPGQATLVVKPTKAARQALALSGKLKAKLKLVFTPSGGSPSTQVSKVKLKR
jgi:hypothetical protein